jgi:hypothetical protein
MRAAACRRARRRCRRQRARRAHLGCQLLGGRLPVLVARGGSPDAACPPEAGHHHQAIDQVHAPVLPAQLKHEPAGVHEGAAELPQKEGGTCGAGRERGQGGGRRWEGGEGGGERRKGGAVRGGGARGRLPLTCHADCMLESAVPAVPAQSLPAHHRIPATPTAHGTAPPHTTPAHPSAQHPSQPPAHRSTPAALTARSRGTRSGRTAHAPGRRAPPADTAR